MKTTILTLSVMVVAVVFLGSTVSDGGDVRVMYAVGLLDVGERARLLTPEEFNRYLTNYDKFKDQVEKAITLREMVQNGWTIVHVESLRRAEPYREAYYLFIFQ
jgi:hypothetical protein